MTKNFLDFAVDLAYKAGEVMKTNFSSQMKKEWKSDHTPLTISDKKINQMVIDNVQKYYPTHSIIAEEGSAIKESNYVWICDPIDGTVPFSHGIPTSVFTLALTKNGESVLGVLFDPFMNRLITAQKGQGAYRNNKKIQVSSVSNLKGSVIDVETWLPSNPYDIGQLNALLTKEYCFAIALRSTFYAGMLVATGDIGAVVAVGTNPWDGAVLKIVVEEANGKVTDLFGNDQKYDRKIKGIIASNGLLHDKLLERLRNVLE